MLSILGCITEQHDIRLVLLAAIICAFGCYTTLSVLGRAGASDGPRPGWFWPSAAAAVAGATVWATHFVAMLAYEPGVIVGYDIGLTLLSIAIAMSVTWVGFAVALRFGRPALGGAVFGLAVGGMHYTGMAALNAPAHFQWDAGYIVVSVAIGAAFGAIALPVFSRGTELRWRLAGATLMTLAIAGLHFTAMTALTLELDPLVEAGSAPGLAPEWLVVAITAVMVMIVTFGLSGSAIDQHLARRSTREAARLRAHVAELETTKSALEATAQSLQQALEAAAAASQAKSQFLATMSHELRTPLNAIIGFSEILAKEMFGPHRDARYTEYAGHVLESGRHLLNLINDVLVLSKIDAGHFEIREESFDLSDVVRSAIRMLRPQAEAAGVHLSETVAANLPRLRADQQRVRQVVLNLVSNAVKFTPSGGHVRVESLHSPDGLAIAVVDDGIGMAPEDIPKALERFGQIDSSLSRKYEGTGLGLPLSKRLVELHGGTLVIESAVGAGTTVRVTFPAERVIAEAAAA